MNTSENEATIGITQNQLAELMDKLQQVKFGQHSASSSDTQATANCADIFLPHSASFPKPTKTHLWIIDSGAFEHMNFDLAIMTNVTLLAKPINVTLPNSQRVKVTHAGQVTVHPQLTLHTVLFVPDFKLNLISVHRLCKHFILSLLLVILPVSCRAFLLGGHEFLVTFRLDCIFFIPLINLQSLLLPCTHKIRL